MDGPYDYEHEDALVDYEKPSGVPYDPGRLREWVRSILVLGLFVVGFGSLLATAGLFAFDVLDGDEALKAAGILSPLVGATTTALAFYFRSA